MTTAKDFVEHAKKQQTVDLANFNYGAGWPSDIPMPEVYIRTTAVEASLRAEAKLASDREWKMTEARRQVRIASTPVQREAAVANLSKVYHDIFPVDNGLEDI